MSNVILEVKKLVSKEVFDELKNELACYEDWEDVYYEILREIEEEKRGDEDYE